VIWFTSPGMDGQPAVTDFGRPVISWATRAERRQEEHELRKQALAREEVLRVVTRGGTNPTGS
jgi:hypothetical protein